MSSSICHTPLFIPGDVPLHSVVRSINVFQSRSQHALINPLIKPILQEWFHLRKTHPQREEQKKRFVLPLEVPFLSKVCQVSLLTWKYPKHTGFPFGCQVPSARQMDNAQAFALWATRLADPLPSKTHVVGTRCRCGEQVEKKLRMVPGTLFGLTVPSVFFGLGEDGKTLGWLETSWIFGTEILWLRNFWTTQDSDHTTFFRDHDGLRKNLWFSWLFVCLSTQLTSWARNWSCLSAES